MALREVMDRNNVRGKDLAEAIGVTREAVSRWRSDPSNMTGPNLVGARNFLRQYEPGLEVDDLLPLVAVSDGAEGETVETKAGR